MTDLGLTYSGVQTITKNVNIRRIQFYAAILFKITNLFKKLFEQIKFGREGIIAMCK